MRTQTSHNASSEIAIFGRLLRAEQGELSDELAEYLLSLGFGKADQARMLRLADRNQRGRLSAAEQSELNNYVKASHLLALLHSKVRRSRRSKTKLASRR